MEGDTSIAYSIHLYLHCIYNTYVLRSMMGVQLKGLKKKTISQSLLHFERQAKFMEETR